MSKNMYTLRIWLNPTLIYWIYVSAIKHGNGKEKNNNLRSNSTSEVPLLSWTATLQFLCHLFNHFMPRRRLTNTRTWCHSRTRWLRKLQHKKGCAIFAAPNNNIEKYYIRIQVSLSIKLNESFSIYQMVDTYIE